MKITIANIPVENTIPTKIKFKGGFSIAEESIKKVNVLMHYKVLKTANGVTLDSYSKPHIEFMRFKLVLSVHPHRKTTTYHIGLILLRTKAMQVTATVTKTVTIWILNTALSPSLSTRNPMIPEQIISAGPKNVIAIRILRFLSSVVIGETYLVLSIEFPITVGKKPVIRPRVIPIKTVNGCVVIILRSTLWIAVSLIIS